jgi:hypothetical protein
MKIKVIAAERNSSWIGGSILSSLSIFQQIWIPQEDYLEVSFFYSFQIFSFSFSFYVAFVVPFMSFLSFLTIISVAHQ